MAENSTSEENSVIIEWASSIYGIYWGIWLGFFIDKVSQNQVIDLFRNIKNLKYYLLGGFSLLIVSYSYFLVKWLWGMRSVNSRSEFYRVSRRVRPGIYLLVFTAGAILILGWIFDINRIWISMGIWASVSWVVVISLLVLSDRRGWYG